MPRGVRRHCRCRPWRLPLATATPGARGRRRIVPCGAELVGAELGRQARVPRVAERNSRALVVSDNGWRTSPVYPECPRRRIRRYSLLHPFALGQPRAQPAGDFRPTMWRICGHPSQHAHGVRHSSNGCLSRRATLQGSCITHGGQLRTPGRTATWRDLRLLGLKAKIMRKPHFATALVITTMLALSGCSGDTTAPENQPFDPVGTKSDLGAIDASFQSSPMVSYTAVSGLIGGTLRGSGAAAAVRAAPSAELFSGGSAAIARYAADIRRADLARPALLASASAIPEQYLGVTFIYDLASEAYVASEVPGAPEDGVRFVLYEGDSSTGVPNEPLVEVGHADITAATSSAGSSAVRIVVSFRRRDLPGLLGRPHHYRFDRGDDDYRLRHRWNRPCGLRVEYTARSCRRDAELSAHGTTRDNFLISIEAQVTDSLVTVDVQARGGHGTWPFQES